MWYKYEQFKNTNKSVMHIIAKGGTTVHQPVSEPLTTNQPRRTAMWKLLTVRVNYYTNITHLVWVKKPYDMQDILVLMEGLNIDDCTVNDYNPNN
mgnify:FL=1